MSLLIRKKPLKRSAFKPSSSVLAPLGKAGKRKASADAAWRKFVRERAGGICQCCGNEGSESHHAFEKGSTRFAHLRHDVRGGIYLCRTCHQTAHIDRVAFREWAKDQFSYFAPLYAEMSERGQA